MELQGTTALLTGASGGLGRAIADALAGQGATVVASGRRRAELDAVAARVGGRSIVADLATPGGIDNLIEAAGAIDVLVANAAVPASGWLLDYDSDQIGRALDVNLLAPILLARAALPAMIERGRGQVVLVSSLSGLAASPGSSLYSATKFGLRGFGHALRQDLHGTGVGVSLILPGFVRDAGMFANSEATLPRWVGTRSSAQVARATVAAIESDRAEVLVAPWTMRIGAYAASIAPALAARVTRASGGGEIAAAIADGQRRYR